MVGRLSCLSTKPPTVNLTSTTLSFHFSLCHPPLHPLLPCICCLGCLSSLCAMHLLDGICRQNELTSARYNVTPPSLLASHQFFCLFSYHCPPLLLTYVICCKSRPSGTFFLAEQRHCLMSGCFSVHPICNRTNMYRRLTAFGRNFMLPSCRKKIS